MIRKSFCETFVMKYSTAIRILVAKELMERYGLSQLKASKLAGIPQPLLNYVINRKRKLKGLEDLYRNPKVIELIKSIAEEVYKGLDIDMCTICILLRRSNAVDRLVKEYSD